MWVGAEAILLKNTVMKELERLGFFMCSEAEILADPQAALWAWIATWPNETIRIL